MKLVKKLSKEEVATLTEYQLETNELVGAIGQIELQKDLLKNKKIECLEAFSKLRVKQQKTADSLQKKYGDGNINLEKEEFIPLK
tara:strand:+ start:454 stop:708 length:255 start_codon:yes stop_codon:yes gene_type:complete